MPQRYNYELVGFSRDNTLFQTGSENLSEFIIEWYEIVKPIDPNYPNYERSHLKSIELRRLGPYLQKKKPIHPEDDYSPLSYLEQSCKSWRYHNLQSMYRVLGTVIRITGLPHRKSFDFLPKLRN